MTEITPEALEALIVELRCGDPSGAKCDKASDMLIKICRALRTGQLILAQPSGDEKAEQKPTPKASPSPSPKQPFAHRRPVMSDLVGGVVCNGCGKPCGHAPGIGYFCQNDACTYEQERSKAWLRQMKPLDPRDARITELETSLAEAEGRVIAEVVAWLRETWMADWDQVTTALETGDWRNAQSV